MRLHKKAIVYSALVLSLSSMVLQLLGFLYRIVLSRIAGAQTVGNLSLLMSVYSVIMSATLSGITMAVSRLSSERDALGDQKGVQTLVKTAIVLFLLVLAILSVPFVHLSAPIGQAVFKDDACGVALILLIPCLFLTGFENIFKNCFYGIKFLCAPITSELLEQTVRILAAAVLLLRFRPDGAASSTVLIVCAMIVSELFSSLTLFIFYRYRMRRRKSVPRLFNDESPSAFSFVKTIGIIALPISAAGIANNLISALSNILIPNRLIVSGMTATEAVTAFGTMSGMTMPMLMLPSAFIFPLTTVLVPRLARGIALSNRADVQRKTAKAIHVTGLLAAPFAAVLVPLGPVIAQLLYHDPAAGYNLLPLAVANLFCFYQIITASILNGIGEQKKASSNVLFTGIIELVLIWIFVGNPRFQMNGFVIGHLVSSVIGALFNFVSTMQCTGIHLRFRNWFVTPVLCSTLAGMTAWLLFGAFEGALFSLTSSLVFACLGALIVYLLALQFMGTNLIKYLRSILS